MARDTKLQINFDDFYKNLAAACLQDATYQVRDSDPEAAAWLIIHGYYWLVDFLGIEYNRQTWLKWIREGCPDD